MSLVLQSEPAAPSRWRTWLRRLTIVRHLPLPLVLIAFLVQGLRLAPGYRGQMNPDGVSYLTIARQYLAGHFADAVNAYWSPLYSWLLVPLMAAGVEPLLATKVLAVMIGAGLLAAAWWLMRNLAIPLESRLIVSLTLFPILYSFGMEVTTPDLLMAATLVLYLAYLTRPRWGRRWWDGLASGLLAGLAYLAKAYALPVLAGHVVLVTVFRYLPRRNRRRRELLHCLVAACGFAVVVGAWSAVLTQKYGFFTTGSTGRFNISYNGPKWQMPMHGGRLLALPNDTGTSGWDDATVLEYPRWDPLATREDRLRWEKNRDRNELQVLAHLRKFTWLLWPIALIGLRLAGSRLDPKPRRPGAMLVTLLALYPLGYWLLHVEQRFLSVMCVGLLMLGAFVATRLTWPLWRPVRIPLRVLLVAAVAWSFLSRPEYDPRTEPWPMALGRWSIAKRWGQGRENLDRAQALAGLMPPRSRVAANGDWSAGLYTGFLLDLRYYGDLAPTLPEPAVRAELAKHGVEFFWVWGGRQYGFLKDTPEIAAGRVKGLRIYDLRPKPPTTAPAP